MITVFSRFEGRFLRLVVDGGELVYCDWAECPELDSMAEETSDEEKGLVTQVINQLEEYFAGNRTEFSLPIRMSGTDFQRRIWTELLTIPYGDTITYAELARRIGKPGACRAVANACGANNIVVIIPCHRVVASCGRLGGYTGGVDIKRALLGRESLVLL